MQLILNLLFFLNSSAQASCQNLESVGTALCGGGGDVQIDLSMGCMCYQGSGGKRCF